MMNICKKLSLFALSLYRFGCSAWADSTVTALTHMKIASSKPGFAGIVRVCAISVSLLFSTLLTVNAQTTTFAQFLGGGGQDYVFTNNTTSADFNAIPGGAPISFTYQNIGGLPPSLQGFQSAHLSVTATTTTPASLPAGTLSQPLDQTVTVQIIRDTPAPAGTGSGSRTNLLTAVFSPAGQTPAISGANGGASASLSVTTPDHVVTFSSDFLSFTTTTQRNMALSFSSVQPSFVQVAGGFAASFTAAATGTFASDPVPTYAAPTAADATISGRVVTADGRGIPGARIVLIGGDLTESENTMTNAFGYFSFGDLEAGHTYAVTVRSKRYQFANPTQAISLSEDAFDVNFVAEP
jgi:hypothetical protein